jgi:hypothetical protein
MVVRKLVRVNVRKLGKRDMKYDGGRGRLIIKGEMQR